MANDTRSSVVEAAVEICAHGWQIETCSVCHIQKLQAEVERLKARAPYVELVSITDKFYGEFEDGSQWHITWNGEEWKFDADAGDFRDVKINDPIEALKLIREYGSKEVSEND